jgi:hypothetical protein
MKYFSKRIGVSDLDFKKNFLVKYNIVIFFIRINVGTSYVTEAGVITPCELMPNLTGTQMGLL